MPYSEKNLKGLPPSTKNLTRKQKLEFIKVFNALEPDIKSGNMTESQAFGIAIKEAKKPKYITKAVSADNLKRDSAGNIIYSGKKFPGFNQPIKSDRDGKQGMVLAKKGNEVKLVHFGDPSMRDNYSAEANDAYYARHGEESDVFSAKYWSNIHLWPKGSMKGKGPKDWIPLKKSANSQEEMVSYEIVLVPYPEKDLHDEWTTEETIIKAQENFEKNKAENNISENLYHAYDVEGMYDIDKTWINQEFSVLVEDTKEQIPKGAWVAKVKYLNEDLWTLKKAGIIQGLSIQCSGKVNRETGEITDISFDPED